MKQKAPSKMRLRVLKPFPYFGNKYEVGDEDEFPTKFAKIMIAVRKAEEIAAEPEPAKEPEKVENSTPASKTATITATAPAESSDKKAEPDNEPESTEPEKPSQRRGSRRRKALSADADDASESYKTADKTAE